MFNNSNGSFNFVKKYFTPVNVVVLLSLIYLILLVIFFVLNALYRGINMDSYAANGTFQLYNPLRRMAAGQVIGRDFPFFHGVGVPILHFPIFRVLGSGVFAAEVSKWLTSPLMFIAASFLFFWAYFRCLKKSTVATAIFSILALRFIYIIWPGNSLIGFRLTFPFIVAAFILWRPKWQFNFKLFNRQLKVDFYYPFLYLLIGLSLACGTEQGAGVIVAYSVLIFIKYFKARKMRLFIGEMLGLMVIIWLLFSVLTLGNAASALKYALIDIPREQGWYFGTPPNKFLSLSTLKQLVEPRMFDLILVISLGTIAILYGWKTKIFNKMNLSILAFLSIYSLAVFAASLTGYWAPDVQLIPLQKTFGLFLVIFIVKLVIDFITEKKFKEKSYYRIRAIVAIIIIIFFAGYHGKALLDKINNYEIRKLLVNSRRAVRSGDGTYVGPDWHNRIQTLIKHIPKGSSLWSTYTSLYDSINGTLNPSSGGEDYIIHALGSDRREKYTKDFISKKPEYVITLKPTYFLFEEWLWSRHWDFYRELLTNYQLIADNGSHILWRRSQKNSSTQISQEYNLNIQNGRRILFKPSNAALNRMRIYEITVNYRVTDELPFVSRINRYLLEFSNKTSQEYPVSLPKYKTSWTFPIVLPPGVDSTTIEANLLGLLPNGKFELTKATYREISPKEVRNLYIFDNNYLRIKILSKSRRQKV